MKIITFIKRLNGSVIPAECNQDAFSTFVKLEEIDQYSELAGGVIKSNYEVTPLLKEYLDTNDKLRRLVWCYQSAAFKTILSKRGFFEVLTSTPASLSMGLLVSKSKTDLPFYDNCKNVWLDSVLTEDSWESLKREGDTVLSVKTKVSPDRSNWKTSIYEMINHILERWDFLRFNPTEMGETEDGYLSFIYTVTIDKTKFVFHTTERGFDVFATIRFIMSSSIPDCAQQILGEYFTMYQP